MARKKGDVKCYIHSAIDSHTARMLSMVGWEQARIANYLNISVDTLIKFYGKEVHEAPGILLNKAVGVVESHLDKNSLPAATFTLKTRGRWRETDTDKVDETHDKVNEISEKMAKLLEKYEQDA